MIILFSLLAICYQSSGQITREGKCPRPNPVEDFDEEYLIGDWLEGWRIPNYYQRDFKCGQAKHYRDENSTLIEHVDSLLASDGSLITWEAEFVPTDNCRPGEYFITYSQYAREPGVDATFTDADWDSWTIMYSCVQDGSVNHQFMWIWVKDINNCDEKAIAKAVERLGIDFEDLIKVDHNNCPKRN